jgi:hypothetical protein
MDWDNVEFEIDFNVPEDPDGHVVGLGIVDTPRTTLAVAYMFARVGYVVKQMGASEGLTHIWPLGIHLACGESIEYKGPEDVPLENTPCTCGDPTHFFVKWFDKA